MASKCDPLCLAMGFTYWEVLCIWGWFELDTVYFVFCCSYSCQCDAVCSSATHLIHKSDSTTSLSLSRLLAKADFSSLF